MGIERGKIEAVYSEIRRLGDICDWNAWGEHFAEDATFVNSMLEKPIRGREAIQSFASTWPSTIVNCHEWVTIDGNRLVIAWNERQRDDAPAYADSRPSSSTTTASSRATRGCSILRRLRPR
jgi:hypothetical protein